MSRLLGWVALAVAALSCGGRAGSRDRGLGQIGLPDAGAGLPALSDALDAPDSGLDGREPVEAQCGADGVVHHSVEIRRQDQADALQSCTRIAGNLTLHHERRFDLSALRGLRVIEGQLWIDGEDGQLREPSVAGLEGLNGLEQVGALYLLRLSLTDLEPLGRLRSIGLDASEPREFDLYSVGSPGSFSITDSAGFSSLAGLDSLEQVREFVLLRNPELLSLAGMPRLERLDRLEVERCPLVDLGGVGPAVRALSLNATQLTQLAGLGNASLLEILNLSQNAQLTSLEGATFPARLLELSSSNNGLTSLKGLENLTRVESLGVFSDPGLAMLETLAGLEGLVEAGTFLLQGQARLSSLAALRSLQRAGEFRIEGGDALTNLTGLASLREVGWISVRGSQLTELTGLGSLTAGKLELDSIEITSLAGLEQVTPGELSLSNVPRLSTLDGLAPLSTLDALFIVTAPLLADLGPVAGLVRLGALQLIDTGLANLDALSQLRELNHLSLYGNAQLSQVDALSGVSGLGSLAVSSTPVLRSLPRFDNVTGTNCAGCEPFRLELDSNAVLESGPGLPGLQQASAIDVSNNRQLTNLSGLSALRSVGRLAVQDNPQLVSLDLSALESAAEIFIRKNERLDDAPLARLQQIAPVGRVKIVSNSSGPGQLSPCPWLDDGECDERAGDCAYGSDPPDCSR